MLPEKVKIGYATYDVEMVPRAYMSTDDGRFDYVEQMLVVADDMRNEDSACTFIHEMLHAIVYQWGIEFGDNEALEELVVNAMANGLTTVFKENPELTAQVQELLSDREIRNP